MSGKTVLITGTSTGIGAASVARMAAAGWTVYAGVRKPEDGDRLLASLTEAATGASAGLAPYAASKHAVSAFNWSLRAELGRNTKMTSSVVEPGEIKTAIWDKADTMIDEMEPRLTAHLRQRYGFVIDGTRAFATEGRTRGAEADRVAKAVEHALTARRPKARYLVGPDARFVGVMSRLPDRWREVLMDLNAKRMERAGRK